MTRKGLRRLETVTWVVGCYLFVCIQFKPPLEYRKRLIDRTVVPHVLLSQTVHHRAFPRVDTFLPFPDSSGNVLSFGGPTIGGGPLERYHETTTLTDFPRTALWSSGIILSATALIIVLRRQRQKCPDPSIRGFDVVVATNQPASSEQSAGNFPTTSKSTSASMPSNASNSSSEE
jgi:hypothetical protein